MSRFRRHPARRIALIASLALFLAGSNYCLLSAWGGNAAMACLALPRDPAATKAPRCHHCAPSTDHARPAKAGPARSCCPDPVVTPSAPSLGQQDAGAAPISAMFPAVAPDPSPLSPLAWHGRPALGDGRPPTRLVRAPLPPRAPPLS